jgi:hypothetical protein
MATEGGEGVGKARGLTSGISVLLKIFHLILKSKLVAAFKSNGTFQTTETNASLLPQRKTFKRQTLEDMVGDRNKPLGLLLGRKKMMLFKFIHSLVHFVWNIFN